MAYHANLEGVKSFYRDIGRLAEVDGVTGNIEGVSSRGVVTCLLKTRLPPQQ